ncbi:acylphosphatase [Tellurirhabdus rosea]|uniref:acylphosphatase n=1 Tax=Tellurirhabdus rosea TaxID=2674997 RepID=UPI00224E2D1C|nr:acylphosphatase [Tellurirhabdus rosea]
MKKNLKVRITGTLLGTLFRQKARQRAEKLGLMGFAHNEATDELYIEAEGEPEQVDQFAEWCQSDPGDGLAVEKVQVEEGELQGYDRFLEKL